MNNSTSQKQLEIIDFFVGEDLEFRRNVSGKKLTTMKVGGDIDLFFEYEDIVGLKKVLHFLKANNFSYKILGGGSNVVLPDKCNFADIVISPGKAFRYFENLTSNHFEVGSSMPLMQLSRKVTELGFSGLEFASGIPAQLGGAVFMNAGAHGGEMCQVIKKINWLDSDGVEFVSPISEFDYSYRHSGLPTNSIVLAAEIELKESTSERTLKTASHFLDERKKRQPLQYPSSGSIFKNPTGQTAGSLIESLMLKGFKHGGAEISEMHANWIINPNRLATAFDVASLIAYVQQKVHEKYDILLQPEVQIW
jgi:UDP-N-acetylmuramate dehydrogenase